MRFIIFFILSIGSILHSNTLFATEADSGKAISLRTVRKENVKKELQLKGIVKLREDNFGVGLNSNGFRFLYENTQFITVNKKRLLQVEFLYFKDFRERKVDVVESLPESDSKGRYVYGKRNEFFALHFNYGMRKELGEKGERNGVKPALVMTVGASLGFLKPYKLNIAEFDTIGNLLYFRESNPKSYSEDPNFLNKNFIDGKSSFISGFEKIQLLPGATAKIGLNLDMGRNDELVKAFEGGFFIDVYAQPITIMAISENTPYRIGAYAVFMIGRRK